MENFNKQLIPFSICVTAIVGSTYLVFNMLWPSFANYRKTLDSVSFFTLLICLISFFALIWNIFQYIFDKKKDRETKKKVDMVKSECDKKINEISTKYEEFEQYRETYKYTIEDLEEAKKSGKKEILNCKNEEISKIILNKLNINIEIISNSQVLLTATIENIGREISKPKYVSLYIDEGIFDDKHNNYKFPYLLHHRAESKDCALAIATQNYTVGYPHDKLEDDFKDKGLLQKCIPLKHLSGDTINFIAPGERFSEDVVLKIDKPGVYRAILVYIPCDKKQLINDCNHYFKCFSIGDNAVEKVEARSCSEIETSRDSI
jgi:hypothetical protein